MSQGVHSKRSDPPWGALTLLGLLAIATGTGLGYGVMKLRGGSTSTPEPRAASELPDEDAEIALGTLLQRSAEARTHLDVAALEKLEPVLEARRKHATEAERVPLELELAHGLAQRALEAKVRASVMPGAAGANDRAIAGLTGRARDLLGGLQNASPTEVERIDARLRLADGEDVGLANPSLLLPQQADRELHFAVLARPLWEPEEGVEPTEIARHGRWVAEALANETQSSGLLDALRALALLRAGEATRAEPIVLAMLQEVPEQPFALALRELSEGNIAVGANPLAMAPAEPTPGEETPRAEGVVGSESPPVPSRPEPTPAESPAPATSPTPAEPPKPNATPPAPKPAADSPPRPAKPKPAGSDFDALVAEGCKAVRGGNATGGLETLQKAFDLKPGAASVTVCMAEAHHALGREASARALCERVLRGSPKNKQARLLAAELEDARGNKAGAIDHYQKLLEFEPGNATATAYLKKHNALP